MPQNALNSAEWREMLGDDCERVYEELINTLGNLTLTAYNPELSDAPFAEKKAHLKGGFDQDYLVISKELHDLEKWNEGAICTRAKRLAERALEVWPFPELSADVVVSYKPIKKAAPAMKSMTFRAVCVMAEIAPGAELVASEGDRTVVATVTDDYGIRLFNGDVLNSPSRAATRVKELVTGKYIAANGWRYWRVGRAVRCSMTCGRSVLRRLRIPTLSRSSGTASTTIAPSDRTLFLHMPTRRAGRRTTGGMRRSGWACVAFMRRRASRSAMVGSA